jgi:hypothetical protein
VASRDDYDVINRNDDFRWAIIVKKARILPPSKFPC